MENTNNHHPHVHFINNITVSLVLFFRKEEKLVALLIYSSVVRVVSSGFRNRSVATSSGSNLCLEEL